MSVVAGGSVLLQRTPGTGGNAAIRTRGVLGTDSEGRITKTDGGDVLVWAKGGNVDAGVGNRWVEPGPSFQANGPERQALGIPAGPDFDPLPIVSPNNAGPNNGGNTGADGILGIGTEAGGSVVVIASGDVKTHETPLVRSGGTAGGTGTSYDGAHIGAFGVPVYYDAETDPSLVYAGAVALPDAPENRVIVIAGGDVSGDYMVRNGEATLLAGYALPAGVDTPAELASLGLDAPLSVEREQLRGDLDVSALAAGSESRGWAGTLAEPAHRRPRRGLRRPARPQRRRGAHRREPEPRLSRRWACGRGVAKVPTYGPDDFALFEAETGDVVLLGNDAQLPDPTNPGTRAINPLVWLLPPSLTIRTHARGRRAPGRLRAARGLPALSRPPRVGSSSTSRARCAPRARSPRTARRSASRPRPRARPPTWAS